MVVDKIFTTAWTTYLKVEHYEDDQSISSPGFMFRKS
jgi:hypothetical protein